ncbi:MAG: hypothetical protein ACI8P3_003313 [Saprospiraceae bacterium]|jgi:hypothetical protein
MVNRPVLTDDTPGGFITPVIRMDGDHYRRFIRFTGEEVICIYKKGKKEKRIRVLISFFISLLA